METKISIFLGHFFWFTPWPHDEMIFRAKKKGAESLCSSMKTRYLNYFLILLNTHFAKMKVSRLSTRRMDETVWKRRLLRDFAQ